MKLQAGLLIVVALIAGASVGWRLLKDPAAPAVDPRQRGAELRAARAALDRGDAAAALEAARRALEFDSRHAAALNLAGEAARRMGRPDQAVEYFLGAAEASPDNPADGLFFAAQVRLEQVELNAAEKLLRQALEANPQHVLSCDRLEFLLRASGRLTEAAPFALQLIELNRANQPALMALASPEHEVELPPEWLAARPRLEADVLPLIAFARATFEANQLAEARSLLQRVVAIHPDSVDAQALLGRIATAESPEALAAWRSALPASMDDAPHIQSLIGDEAARSREWSSAARAYARAIQGDPRRRRPWTQLAICLSELGREPDAAEFRQRGLILDRLDRELNELYLAPAATARYAAIAEHLAALGRIAEARAWLQLTPPQSAAAVEAARRIAQFETAPQTSLIPRLPADLLMEVPEAAAPAALTGGDVPEMRGPLQFQRAPDDVAPGFTFINGTAQKPGEQVMAQSNGGGIAAFDYDVDGACDLYFTQGGDWPPDPNSPGPPDQLFRNLDEKRFVRCTESTRIVDEAFGQGVAAGDVDADGFPDLFLANIGPNALWMNMGDGTFSAAPQILGDDADEWSTSAGWGDLNGDGLDDVFVVNYMIRPNADERICHVDGRLRSCQPTDFSGDRDRLFLNDGEQLRDVSATAGLEHPDGRGLGLILADFNADRRLEAFVANDAVPNSLFVSSAPQGGFDVQYTDEALACGVATDGAGANQACMGVAADDCDGDGLLDLFVTNYHLEFNTLYRNHPGMLFGDETQPFRLARPSYAMLGFGTQFSDFDLDGWPDLVVVNGHIDDLSASGVPYAMRPQVFRNLQGREFAEEFPEGPFFHTPRVSRALAELDWNGDGRPDFAVGQVDGPSDLVTNTTDGGHALELVLVGRRSSRDAAGTTVELLAPGRTQTRQLVAGGGFQATHERVLRFGLGEERAPATIEVRWPSGQVDRHEGLVADGRYAVVESGRAWGCRP